MDNKNIRKTWIIRKMVEFTLYYILVFFIYFELNYLNIKFKEIFLILSPFFIIGNIIDKTHNRELRKILLTIAGHYTFIFIYFVWTLPIVIIFKMNLKYYLIFFIIYSLFSYINNKIIKLKKYRVFSKKIKKEYKILFFSDLHLSELTNKNKIKRIIKKIKEIDFDFILIGGDILDYDYKLIDKNIIFLLKETIKEISKKVYTVIGNHDVYDELEKYIEFCKLIDVEILADDSFEYDELSILGRKERHLGRKQLKEFYLKKDKYNICIEHSPLTRKEILNYNIDLYLAGHTHAGQIFPINILYKIIYKKIYGYFKEREKEFIISSGIGNGFMKYRNMNSPEVILLEIKKSK
ncbi:hypothetical protein EV215_1018 [Hypnocyclicus thermotrophus]|uniref:Calcineurin-like phosphoesterase domain-containing protein n=1 Tax=Hypnocyclicus thermotrophus TaxID=1627895 RepID=A0AA46DYL6_9FUSO|nr:metallophosphoesterase [Hypnocyclicus thermotrophus]TDT70473.1 hypothetical protein EV215_1018 [Hypnocyclicus thermotrophus]